MSEIFETIQIMRKNLGPVTAYKYAVQQGYTGTEQEFAALMASYATVAEEAESAKDDAVDAKTAAEAAQAAAEAAAEQAEGAIEVDDTLSVEGRAADAKAVGNKFNEVSNELHNSKSLLKPGIVEITIIEGKSINSSGVITDNANHNLILFDVDDGFYFVKNVNKYQATGICGLDSNGNYVVDGVTALVSYPRYNANVRRNSSAVKKIAVATWKKGHTQGSYTCYDDPFVTHIAEISPSVHNEKVMTQNTFPFVYNIFNPIFAVRGKYYNPTDESFANNTALMSYGLVPVTESDVLSFTFSTENNYSALTDFAIYFDASFNYVSSSRFASSLTVPPTANYVLFTFYDSDSDNIFITKQLANAPNIKIDSRAIIASTVEDVRAYPLYVNLTDDVIEMTYKYDAATDMTVQMQKQGGLDSNNLPIGGNQLFDFCRWFKTSNTSNVVTDSPDTDISGKTAGTDYKVNGTDFLAPYRVRAVNNADGDKESNNDFTGGNHQYNNSGSGSTPTARTANLVFVIDGKPATSYSGYCRNVEISWDNFIQGNNTKKSDGTGREILKEHYTVRFDGYKFEVCNKITALEDLYIYTYYGEQMKNQYAHVNARNIEFLGSKATKAPISKPASGITFSGDKCAREVINTNSNTGSPHYGDVVEMGIENVGLGDFEYAKTEPSSCLASTGKIYFNLVNAFDSTNNVIDLENVLELSANDVIYYRGWYKFYKKH